eukprot:EC720198.1.p2 GENE.EC720198.1~~EC720198.1.p2  ORF type:complete len:71 (-),score=6.75 EC720198.1:178-390(-)
MEHEVSALGSAPHRSTDALDMEMLSRLLRVPHVRFHVIDHNQRCLILAVPVNNEHCCGVPCAMLPLRAPK